VSNFFFEVFKVALNFADAINYGIGVIIYDIIGRFSYKQRG